MGIQPLKHNDVVKYSGIMYLRPSRSDWYRYSWSESSTKGRGQCKHAGSE